MIQSSEFKKKHEQSLRFWEKHFRNWQTSGLSQAKYCEQAGVSYAAFCYWRSCINKERSKLSITEPASFKPAVVKSSQPLEETQLSITSAIQVVLPNGTKIEIPPNLKQAELASIFKVLGGLS